jgi:GNAT superfamily N-acetyltransferase
MTELADHSLIIEPLSEQHERAAFCCGNEYIDNWCKTKAHKDHNNYKSRVFVARAAEDQKVLGIYSLTMRSLQPKRILNIGFGGRDIPAVYFATLGVTADAKKGGIGTALMVDSFKRVLRVSEDVGAYCIWLTCVDEPTVSFYESVQFARIEPDSLDMYVPLQTLRDAFQNS